MMPVRRALAIAAILVSAVRGAAAETIDRVVHVAAVPMVAGEQISGGELILQSADDATAPPRLVPLNSDLRLPAGSRWWLSTSVRRWWSARTLLNVTAGDSPLATEQRLWPTGVLRGALKVVKASDKLPSTITIAARAIPGTPPRYLPDFSIDCNVDRAGAWRCEVPAGRHDLSVTASSYIPAYKWDVAVDRRKPQDLGTIELRKGASIAGWAAIDERGAKLTGAKAVVTRLIATGADARIAQRLGAPVAQTTVGANGFFQLAGIEGGTYRVRVEHDGFAPSAIFPVRVFAGSETLIRHTLILQRPLHVRATVTPARDASDKPWRLTLSRIADFSTAPDGAPVFDAPIDDSGGIDVPDQAPGTFRATVSDSAGNQRRNR